MERGEERASYKGCAELALVGPSARSMHVTSTGSAGGAVGRRIASNANTRYTERAASPSGLALRANALLQPSVTGIAATHILLSCQCCLGQAEE